MQLFPLLNVAGITLDEVTSIFFQFQEDQNRGKPNWEHLNDDLHVLITVEDTENRASLKLQRAVDEVKKLLIVVGHQGCRFTQPTVILCHL